MRALHSSATVTGLGKIWNKQARPRRIIPGNFLFPQQKRSLLAPEDAKLVRYNPAATILLPGGKILSENEANQEMSSLEMERGKFLAIPSGHLDLVMSKITSNHQTFS